MLLSWQSQSIWCDSGRFIYYFTYDPLYRLKEANYSGGRYFHFTYDAVGNRLTEEKCPVVPCTVPITNTYVCDSANRLTSVNGQTYQWDNNGNLLNDGASAYTYDAANRLKAFGPSGQPPTSTYAYNGLGDRLSQTVDSVTTNYVLDLNAGLTQVLADGANTYLYGPSTGSGARIGELQPGGFAYHLSDALGSVRQLTGGSGGVTLAKTYEPYGSPLASVGTGSSVFAFTGEQWDAYTELTFLRARWYRPETGTFQSKDVWPPDYNRPLSLNRWAYVEANPTNLVDPSGHHALPPGWPNDDGDWELRYRVLKELNLDTYIRTASHEYQVPKILLAASLMVQGALTYFYPYEGLQIATGDLWDECYQATSPIIGNIPVASDIYKGIDSRLQGAIGTGASLGIAQMTAEEVQKYLGVTCEDQCLVENFEVSIRAMAAKIASIREDPVHGMMKVNSGITPWFIASPTEHYVLYATAQNNAATFSGTWQICYFREEKRGNDTDSIRERWKCINQRKGDDNGYPNINYMLKAVKTLVKHQWYLSSSVDIGLWEEIAGYK